MDAIKMLRPGDPCPCCGQPIKTKDPDILAFLTHVRDSGCNVREYMLYREKISHASGRNST